MTGTNSCERCGAAMGPDVAQGLCPACLLEAGLRDSQATAAPPTGGDRGGGKELAEIARLFPQLELLEWIGRGGMGVVYKARHRGLDRLVALKVLPTEVDRDPGFRERFVREARALARLNHPNIVSIYDFGQVEGRYYFQMEFVDGASLRAMLQGAHLTPEQAMAIVPQLCDALQFAHEEGIVHRDIKPENILLDRKGRVKIADFGLAKLLGGAVQQDPYTLTSARQVLGTPHYMAPEQFERPSKVDHRADIYSMGVVFYEMLTGELPLGRFPVPSRKVHIDVRLDEVVLRTLEKEPEQRYQHAGDVKTELASLTSVPAGGQPPTCNARGAAPGGVAHSAPPALPERVSPFAASGLVCLIVSLAVWFVVALGSYFAREAGGPPMAVAAILTTVSIVLGLVATAASCALGIAGIRQVRRLPGRYYGLKLALFDALFYPLLVLDLFIFYVVLFLENPPPDAADRVALLTCLATIALDVFLVRTVWRRVSRPVPPGRGDPNFVAQPPALPPNYHLPPRRRLGWLAVCGLLALILLILFISLAVPAIQADRARIMARQAELQHRLLQEATVRVDASSDSRASAVQHTYRFEIHSPADEKMTVWAEIWRNGKLITTPGFGATQWVIPPRGQPFDGSATFTLGPTRGDGKTIAGWQISGTAGTYSSQNSIDDPFAGTSLRDSTWGVSSASWTVSPRRPLQLLALRGGVHQLVGSAGDERLIGHADGEIRLFVRFDPLTESQMSGAQPGAAVFGESATPPARGGSSSATSHASNSQGSTTRTSEVERRDE